MCFATRLRVVVGFGVAKRLCAALRRGIDLADLPDTLADKYATSDRDLCLFLSPQALEGLSHIPTAADPRE